MRDAAPIGGIVTSAIDIQNLRFRYPGSRAPAIDALSLQIAPGSLFGLLGPNGSGKTTLISLLIGLLQPQAGRLRLGQGGDGMPLRMAWVPQDYAFYPRLSVDENLRFFAAAAGLGRSARSRIATARSDTGLEEFRRVRARRLSGGLKRRLNLAIGLLNAPELLLLDEPTVGIDPQSRHFILEAIRRLNRAGTTIVYTSHYMEEVEALCDRIGILDRGKLLACDDLPTLLGSSSRLVVVLEAPPAAPQPPWLDAFPGLQLRGAELRLDHCAAPQLRRLLACLEREGLRVIRIRYGHADLEDLFLHLTGRQLRDD